MKKLVLFACCFFMLHFCIRIEAQNNTDGSLGLPGDNLNLYAVMKLFQESRTLELFERNLNDENSRINNLDLNGDGRIDYISVIDNFDGKVHMIILRDAISQNESQDVAVFYVSKDAGNRPQIQLIGDEALYGKDYIIEPTIGGTVNNTQTINPGYTGNREVIVERSVVIGTSAWPLLGLLFLPTYVVWHSPYYYGYYPSYWRPWQPLYWHSYYGYHSNMDHYYFRNYRRSIQYRDIHFREHYYSGRRSFAPIVIQHRNDGFYKRTYSHPELRSEGSDRYNKLHPGNANRGGRPEVQTHRENPPSREIGNRSAVNRNDLPANRSENAVTRPAPDRIRNRTPEASPANNQRNVRPSEVTPPVNQNNQAASEGRRPVNQNITRPSETRSPVNQSYQSPSQVRQPGNQNNARTQESRPQVNQNYSRPVSRPSGNTESIRPSNNRASAPQSGGQNRSTQTAKPASNQRPAGNQPARPNKVPNRNENAPK